MKKVRKNSTTGGFISEQTLTAERLKKKTLELGLERARRTASIQRTLGQGQVNKN